MSHFTRNIEGKYMFQDPIDSLGIISTGYFSVLIYVQKKKKKRWNAVCK